MNKVKLTKSVADKAKAPESGQAFIRDTVIPGFSLRITSSGAKAFILEKRIQGKVRRMTLGKYGAITCEEARKLAKSESGKIAMGQNPIAERQQEKISSMTLKDAYDDYIQDRAELKPRTLHKYNGVMNTCFNDWLNKPITSITKAMVLTKHKKLSTKKKRNKEGEIIGTHGQCFANQAMRLLRAIFNFAQAKYDDLHGISLIPENPVLILTRLKAWNKVERRQSVLKVHELPHWYQSVQRLYDDELCSVNSTVADYLLLLLFTGLRKNEGLQLRWSAIDFEAKTLCTDTKTQKNHTLPLSDYLIKLLKKRHDSAINDYVFPGHKAKRYLVEPRNYVNNVIEDSGIQFMLHDLRRTFITSAERLDISPYTIKRLVGHSISHDVTAGYIVTDVERLREPMQKVTDYLKKALGIEETPVIELPLQQRNI